MSIKRIYKDPAGLLPDTVAIELDDASTDFADVAKLLKSKAPAARIDRLRRHDAMRTTADLLLVNLEAATSAEARHVVLADLSSAERNAMYLDVAPKVMRDNKRLADAKKERRPDVTDWIAGQLRADPSAKAPDLWRNAPEWLTDQLGFERFRKRVTHVRKGR